MNNNKTRPYVHLALTTLLTALLVACGGAAGGPPQMPPPSVNVAVVVQKDVTEWDEFSGRIEAVEKVEIRPRVTGYLTKVNFAEGQEVKKGDVLFEIDDREYRAVYQRSLADIDRANTRIQLAQREVDRADKMLAARAISQEEHDTRTAELAQAKADAQAMQAQAVSTKLNVDFAHVISPIDGRAGRALVTVGNLVTSGMPAATLLTTVVSLDPVYVMFEGDERVYLKYQQMAREGDRPSSRDVRNPVRLGLANEEGYPHEGYMDFVDNELDPNTGTIKARAVFANADRIFTPGLFARIQLLGSGSYQALLIHDQAVSTDQDRKFVYVLGPENKAMRKDVKLGPEVDGLRVVTDGLKAGDVIIVNGVQKVFFPGMPVAPTTVPMNQPELAPPQAAPAKAAG